MNFSTGWRTNKEREKRARVTRKPKPRWEVLGLPGPVDMNLTTSMEDIRRQVSNMASGGFGQGTRSRMAETEGKAANRIRNSKKDVSE
jgi:hypothetical protein